MTTEEEVGPIAAVNKEKVKKMNNTRLENLDIKILKLNYVDVITASDKNYDARDLHAFRSHEEFLLFVAQDKNSQDMIF